MKNKIKNTLLNILIFIIIFCIFYGISAFTSLDIDYRKWDAIGRYLVIYATLIIGCLIVAIRISNQKEK